MLDNNINELYDPINFVYPYVLDDECIGIDEEPLEALEDCENQLTVVNNFNTWAYKRVYFSGPDLSTPGNNANDWWLCGSENDLLSNFCEVEEEEAEEEEEEAEEEVEEEEEEEEEAEPETLTADLDD